MKWLKRIVVVLVVLLLVAQAVPYGRAHDNPPVTKDAPWPTPAARALAVRACYDCHSNETRWPWYSHVAPMSWLVQKDVDEGRRHLNFSEWDRPQRDAHEAAEELEEGKMPPAIYLPLHPDAKLSGAEKAELLAALRTMAPDDRGGRRGGGER